MLTCTSEVVTSPQILLALWKHECFRVIADRFTILEDKDWFEKECTKTVEEECGAVLAKELAPEPYFTDFMRDAPEPTGTYEAMFHLLVLHYSSLMSDKLFICK